MSPSSSSPHSIFNLAIHKSRSEVGQSCVWLMACFYFTVFDIVATNAYLFRLVENMKRKWNQILVWETSQRFKISFYASIRTTISKLESARLVITNNHVCVHAYLSEVSRECVLTVSARPAAAPGYGAMVCFLSLFCCEFFRS
jgi:hypothetical protein